MSSAPINTDLKTGILRKSYFPLILCTVGRNDWRFSKLWCVRYY